MRTIPISRGLEAIVDDIDFDRIAAFAAWIAKPIDRATGGYYAICTRDRTSVYMHRLILGATKGTMVDHANGDGLDNRRGNLRIASGSQNGANRASVANKSGYRGVYCEKGVYRARLWSGGRAYSLGMFSDVEEAARAYDSAALGAFGEFARLNFPAAEGRS